MQQTELVVPPTRAAIAAFERLIETVWNGRDVGRLAEVLAPGFVMRATSGQEFDAAGYEAAVRAYHEGFSDLRVEVVRAIEQDGVVAARIRLAGTMDGPFGGHAATGRAMRVEAHPWIRVEDGKVAELWSLVDDAMMWAQLGLPPHVL